MTLHLFLRPLDVWLFRDGRPFDAGSANRAESLFPPYPTVIQGAFRTNRLLRNGVDLKDKDAIEKMVGKANEFGNLYLCGPYLAKWDGQTVTRYFPQPADAIANGLELVPAKLVDKPPTLKTSTSATKLFGLKQISGKPKETLWLDEDSLQKYLTGESVTGTPASELFLREDRVGIGMNEKRVVDEGMLYEAEFIRPRENIGLLVEVDDEYESDWQKGGILLLGGEGKQALVEKVTVKPASIASASTSRFKMYLTTPAYFEEGWKPSDWKKFFKGDVTLTAAAINRYETIGGFNWAGDANGQSAHRPARRFVPAGSVYYFEGLPQFTENQRAVTDFGAQIGFGQTIIKEIKEW